MKKSSIIFFAVMAIVLVVAAIHSYNSVDVIEMQQYGMSYLDALKLEANAVVESYYLGFTAFVSFVMCFVCKKAM